MAQWNFKVVLAGDGAVGKTSIRERYMGKGFTGDYLKTIGADFASKKIDKGEHKITFQIWDLAGQESYQAVRGSFYKGAIAGLLVFDCQDPKTMTNLSSWLDEAIENSGNGILVYFVIANKVDLVDKRRVSKDMAIEFCNRLETETGIRFFYCETSALTGQNIQETFDYLAYKLLEVNNIKNIGKPELSGSIVDISTQKSDKIAPTGDYITRKEFEGLVDKIEKLEDKFEAIQNIIKKIVEKIQG